ncbi:MAG: gliding motility protein GldC [Chitinophagaceae bacterium]
MHQSEINFKVTLDEEKMPQTILWHAPDGGVDTLQEAKGLLLGIWDGTEKSALRIDLWTKSMMVDEMADFFYQSLMGMADTYNRATNQIELCNELKSFAGSFYKKAMETIEAGHKA